MLHVWYIVIIPTIVIPSGAPPMDLPPRRFAHMFEASKRGYLGINQSQDLF